MYKIDKISVLRILLFVLNFLIIILMSSLLVDVTRKICWNNIARQFLGEQKNIPTAPEMARFYSIILFGLLIVGDIVKHKLKNKYIVAIVSIIDITICIYVAYVLGLGYAGTFLLVIANGLVYIDRITMKFIFVLTCAFLYITLDRDIFILNNYMKFFTPEQRYYFPNIRNMFIALNQTIFIVFVVMIAQRQLEENKYIKYNNEVLSKTAMELENANLQLKEYMAKTEEIAKLKERNRIAREMHDTIGHYITGITTGLDATLELMDYDMEEAKVQIGKIIELSRSALLDVRRSVHELKPDALERNSLINAIKMLINNVTINCRKIEFHLEVNNEYDILSSYEEKIIYSIVQESITNSIKYSEAHNIWIHIQANNDRVSLNIYDDGKGCDNLVEGYGLKGIRDSVESLKGEISYQTSSANGFKTFCLIPIRR